MNVTILQVVRPSIRPSKIQKYKNTIIQNTKINIQKYKSTKEMQKYNKKIQQQQQKVCVACYPFSYKINVYLVNFVSQTLLSLSTLQRN